ncbi:TonB-linked outer membrane protein, SusC/RagA family [Pedobacter sp. ok626]|uniref:TonB-dependent receptor n=1 Tax=Pedobacter sp. ok626 TaxID=1761882 RepID=UPI000881BD4A|nr:TonB-dependent receptor [Pedobacter sp. ok626]SDK91945.1 TonB-linked outer membrane protein, SusC/RagA family [Pedobacter sp. ok626]
MYKFFHAFSCRSGSCMLSKIGLVVKLTIPFLLAAILQVNAASYGQQVSISVNNTSLSRVFELLHHQTGYTFLYNSAMISESEPVSISVKKAELKDFLDKCFADQPLTYTLYEKTVVVKRKNPVVANIVVTGIIRDAKGETLPQITVRVKGTTIGTNSDSNGAYTLKLPDGSQTLIFSAIGYETLEVAVDNRTQIDVTLKEKISTMNDVVVVGYGSQKKADVTGSIASINEEALKSVPVSNLLSALQAQSPGLDIQKSGGNSHPGAKPAISIRGRRSLKDGASNDVLYVVDGIPFNGTYINDLNQDDVVSVQILKDASATAIYGSRGANGVILISTKRGKTGAAVITYSGYAGVMKSLGHYDVMEPADYQIYKKWGSYNANNPNVINAPNPYTGIDDPRFYTDGTTFLPAELEGLQNGTNTNWQKLIFKNGMRTNHQLGLSGGTEQTKYAISAGYFGETGVFPGLSFHRFSFKVSLDQQLGKIFKVGISSINSVSRINGEGINPVSQALQSSPLTVPYDAAGNLIPFPGGGSLIYNPLANLIPGAVVQNRTRYNTFTTAYAEAQFTPHLKYRFNGGVELTPETYGHFYSSNTFQNLSGPSTGRNSNYDYRNFTLENLVVYENTFAENHHVTGTGLFSYQEDNKYSTTLTYNNILADDVQYYNPELGANFKGTGEYSKFAIVSFMGRINYNFKSKYLLTLTMRSDGSSTLAPGNKYHLFPSAAAGWNISEENFMKTVNAVSSLKLRVGYGTVGNAAVSPYQTLGGLGIINYNYGTSYVTGTYPNNVPNPKLGWEYTASLNMGLDFGLFKDRITGTVDVYQQKTNDLILPQNLPITTGYTSQFLANVGKTENKGLEVSVSTVNIKSKSEGGFSWTSSLNIAFNRNKIVALQNGVTQDVGNNRFVGEPIEALYNYSRQGIWQNTPADSALARKYNLSLSGVGSVIGTIKVADINGDNVINSNDRIVVGTRQPKFLGGFTNRFSYRGIDLAVVCSYRVGGTQIAYWLQPGSNVNSLTGKVNNLNINYWTPFNSENTYPKPIFGSNTPTYGDLLGYYNASYLKIRTISLGYTIPGRLVSKMGIKSLRLNTSLNDAFILFSPLHNRFKGADPESEGTLGVDTPPVKSLLFGLNVTF